MAALLMFFDGAVTVADYDRMPWRRRQTLFEFMKRTVEADGPT